MTLASLSECVGNGLILFFLVGIPAYAYYRKVPVYETFIEGAQEGFPTLIRIIPYMIAMLVAIGMLRASGIFDLLNQALAPFLTKLGIPAEIIPIAILRPFSSTAAMASVADILHAKGGNTFLSHLAVIVSSTTDTTFYLIAIYFGAANIRKNRHALLTSILVDVVGILSAVWITQWLLA